MIERPETVATAVSEMKRERGLGVSEAVNELARRGLSLKPKEKPFRQPTAKLGLKVDVTNVADALDLLDGPASS